MKKINKILTVALAAGVFGGSLAAGVAKGSEAKAVGATELEYSIEITKQSGFFTNWTADAGSFRGTEAVCYNGKTLNALGTIFDGCLDHEGWTGTLNSRRWRQTTQWIYFEYGCANNIHIGEATEVKLVFHLWASENADTPAKSYDFYNDTFSQTTMVLRNFEIPSADYTALGGDFYMSVDLVDGRGNDYGANEFGYLHVNQTHEQVSAAQWYYYTHCAEGESASVGALRSHYYLNGSLRNGFATGFAESFDTQESFNTNWLKDGYGNGDGTRHADKAISESTYRKGGANLPFNNKNGFFKGWYGGANLDDEDARGYVDNDWAIYRFVSKPFRLPENGIISVKMAGNGASLHLLDFDGSNDELAWVDCRTFVTGGDGGLVAKGEVNSCTLVNHIINFSKYAGRVVQIGIADVANGDKAGGWQTAYFDELKANYASLPSFNVEVVEQNGSSYAILPDYYVKATEGDGGVDYAKDDGPATDASPLYGAYLVWKSYLDTVRGGKNGNNYCNDVRTSDEVKAMLNAYRVLSDDAKAVVWASEDYERVGSGDYWTINPTIYEGTDTYNIRRSVEYLASLNGISVNSSSAFLFMFGTEAQGTAITIIIASTTLIALAIGLLMLRKKRRQ